MILVTVKQLEELSDLRVRENSPHVTISNLERMQLVDSPVRNAIRLLKQFPLEMLLGVCDEAVFGRGKRIFVHFNGEKRYLVSLLTCIHPTRHEQSRYKRGDCADVFRAQVARDEAYALGGARRSVMPEQIGTNIPQCFYKKARKITT